MIRLMVEDPDWSFHLEFFLLFTWCWEVRFSRLQLEAKELENQTMRLTQEW